MEDKELIKFVKKKIKKRERSFIKDDKQQALHRTIYYVTLAIIVFITLTIPLVFISEAPNYLGFLSVVFILMGVGVMYHSRILMSKNPAEKQDKDKWLWIQGRRMYLLKNTIAVLALICLGIMLIYDLETVKKAKFYKYIPIIATVIACELAANSIVLFITVNPKCILDGVLTGIGSALKSIAVFLGTLILFSAIIQSRSFLFLLLLLFLLPYFMGYMKYLIAPYNKNRLNQIQTSVVEFVNPSIFLASLRKELKIIKDKSEALEVIKNLKKNNKYGVEVALLEELTLRHTNKTHWLISFIIVIAIFVVGAMSEGFVQDLINEPIKKLFEG